MTEQAAVKRKRMEIRPPSYTERIATKRREERTANNYGEERRHVYYYHGDHLGSAQVVTDYRGEVYEHIEYTPYGELWVEHAPNVEATPFRFTGKERDSETGLYYYGARYLNPQTGMWLSTDPAMGEYIPQAPLNDEARKHNQNLPGMGGVFNTVNLHTYHYAGNNPVRYTDPDGRKLRLAYNSSDNFKKNYNEAMSYLMHSRTARGIINILHGDSRIVEIEFSPISSTINFERTRISWNPKLGLVPGKGGIISPAVALFHEIAHGFLKTDEGKAIFEKWLNEAKAMNSNSDYTDLDWEEEFVTMLERTVGLELGEKSYREKYNDVQMEAIVQSPTFHSNPPEE